MAVQLCPVLEEYAEWQKVREIAEKRMKEWKLNDYTVRISAITPEQEQEIELSGSETNACFDAAGKVLDIIVGSTDIEDLGGAERFAKDTVVATLDQYFNSDSDEGMFETPTK